MQRIALLLVGAAALPAAGAASQEAAGAAFWRLAATTLPVPPALASGPAATLWTPAQTDDSAATQLALEGIQTPAAVGASGVIAVLRVRVRPIGYLGVVYGRVGLSDLTRTGDSPDPIGTVMPVFTSSVGATWARAWGRTTVGATLAFRETRLDVARATRWTLDVGVSQVLTPGGGLRIAAATHAFSSFDTRDPAQDLYAGLEGRVWHGPLWGDRAALRGRYGMAFGHGFAADHHVGVGFEVGSVVTLDAAVVREGSYDVGGWRPVAGVRVTVGKYRVTVARDAGMNDLGSAYRVGVDARFP